ncbi:MAG: hypothetical protein H0Z35_07625 [Thermoanaerobacteraceae bacterium]|nr:hypothetical protein [Thermoanaerobacteraceae bacterium]
MPGRPGRHNLPFEKRQEIVRKLVKRVVVCPDTVEIEGYFQVEGENDKDDSALGMSSIKYCFQKRSLL